MIATPAHLCISIRFLDPVFHGRRDGDESEWPPSPIRLFQALVATAARLEPLGISPTTHSTLEWLEQRPDPPIVVPTAERTIGRRISVPNNAMDIVARAWSRGNDSEKGDADPRTHRTMKTVRPLTLHGGDTVRFVWALGPDLKVVQRHTETMAVLAESVTALGWGIDMAIGQSTVISDDDVDQLPGEHWRAGARGVANGLRVPVKGTLADLINRHERFVNRLGPDGFTAPPPLSCYDTVEYRRTSDLASRPWTVFSILKMDASGFKAFDPVRKGLTLAGMVRHATKSAAESSGWLKNEINRFVLGHGESKDGTHAPVGPQRFAYLPIPSLEARGGGRRAVGSVRRVIVTAFSDGCESEISWARQMLSAQELLDERSGESVALLSILPASDKVIRQYTERSDTWATVTPVVLPGYDDPDHLRRKAHKNGVTAEQKRKRLDQLSDRIDRLLRKSIVQGGLSKTLADHAIIDWRKVGFLPGVDLADRYGVPDHLKRFGRYHVRINFRDAHDAPVLVPGPICIGGGRFYGLGLFTRDNE